MKLRKAVYLGLKLKLLPVGLVGAVFGAILVVGAVTAVATADPEGPCPGASTVSAPVQQVSIPTSASPEIAALAQAGITVVEVPGWQDRSHGQLADSPSIVWHHDASPEGDSPSVIDWMVSNWNTASAQVWVDRQGAWHIVGNLRGIAYHAGDVAPGRPGNANSIGIETDHTVGEDWPPAQLQSLRAGTSALLELWRRVPADALEFHSAIAIPVGRKVDPDGLVLAEERERVGALMSVPRQALRGSVSAFKTMVEEGSIIDAPVSGSIVGGGAGGTSTGTVSPASSPGCAAGGGTVTPVSRPGGNTAGWDPGNIISDAVFYNTSAMTVDEIRAFIATENAGCSGEWCASTMTVSAPAVPADQYCEAIPAINADAAQAIATVSTACGVSPQVMLVTWRKESRGMIDTSPSASTYAAAFGWHCPDSGPGGSANCDPQYAGFANQLVGMARQWARYRVDIPLGKYRYNVGTYDILWNVVESGCGSAPVTIKNVATASLYAYTPYQPNQAALDAYPGVGDDCSTYGNRNFFRMFQKYFGDTGGGLATGGSSDGEVTPVSNPGGGSGTSTVGGAGPVAVTYAGVTVSIPDHPNVAEPVRGKTIVAPTAKVAAALAHGLSWVGTPYSWGGGTSSGPTGGICESGAAWNDCKIVGFDCSGLTEYVASKWGVSIPGTSRPQRDAAKGTAWSNVLPGDIIGWDGHVALYLGSYGGERWMLEAPQSGMNVQVSRVRTGYDSVVYRYWTQDV